MRKNFECGEDNGKRMQGMLVLQNVFSMCGKSWREWKDRSSQSFEMVQTIEGKCRRIHKNYIVLKNFGCKFEEGEA